MKSTYFLLALLVSLTPVVCAATLTEKEGSPAPTTDPDLYQKISALDSDVFAAFNHCSEPGQLDKHRRFFTEDVEFYHDTGGVTWSRAAMIANTEKFVCGKFRRELVPGSLKVFAIKDFGAIASGSHRFCQFSTAGTEGTCEGLADFNMIWRLKDNQWHITRVLSFGHRANH